MVVNCDQVWGEISNYLDGEVDPTLRAAMEEHLKGCKQCSAVLDGTKNVIELYGDERAMEIPLGFSQRLHSRLHQRIPERRGSAFGWMVALAAAGLLIGAVAVGNSAAFTRPQLRSEHAAPAVQAPPDMMVLVYDDGKTFHAPSCTYIHDKAHARMITVTEATREGFAPCTRCMKQYLGIQALNEEDVTKTLLYAETRRDRCSIGK